MNRIYRLVFSKKRGQLIAVAENSTGKGKGDSVGSAPAIGFASFRLCLDPGRLVCLGMTMLFSATPAWTGTLPAGGAVSVGSGTIATSGNTMTVQQDSQKLGINWQSFSIGGGDKVIFNQPGVSSVALNRVNGGSRSEIYGNLTANGQVFLVNPNGVLFGKTAEVNVGGLLASTGNISDDDFAAGTYSFSGNGGGEVVNQGNLKAVNGGFIVLAANEVRNEGEISATGGSAVLAAGETISLDLDNSGRVQVKVDGSTLKALIDNQGLIEADGGSVVLTARGKEMLQDSAINLMGIVRARSIGEQNGAIVIDGGNVVAENAILDGSGLNAANTGGQVTVTGNSISLSGSTAIDVRGSAGGGTVLVGGDYQGQGELPHARTLNIGANTMIDASATGSGKGGKVVLWSDERTDFRGTINAMGGAAGGDGGLVETSSHGNLQAFGRVRAEAPLGKAGTWLLDPETVTFVESSTPPAETTQGGTTGSQVSTESVNSQAGAGTTVVVQTATGTTQVTADTPAVSSDGNGTDVTNGNETAEDPTTATPVADGISAATGTGTGTVPASDPVPAAAPAAVTDALPSGGSVFTGNGSISTDGGTMTVQQNSEKLGLNWQSFNIGTGNSVVFNQPGATSIALNRVLGGSRSEIYGKLKANGQVFLYNPGGVLFGPTAEVSVGSLSTSDISDSDFAVGTYTAPTFGSEVVNQGSITAEGGGTIELTGDKVENEGTISATGGSVALTSVASVAESAGLLAAITDATARGGLIENKGLIEADGGKITIAAISSNPRQENVINIDGVLRARSIGEESGSIVIDGGGGEVVINNAKVDVSGTGESERGGQVVVTGKNIDLTGTTEIDAKGSEGGGIVRVGGDYQGNGDLAHAETVTMGQNAKIDASATERGDGGQVVLWSDASTAFAGNIAARGGAQSGDGGLIETSGHQLQVADRARVDTRAENGQTGTWLLDPIDYLIAPSGGDITGASLGNYLNSNNIKVQTATTNSGNGDIIVNDAVNWHSFNRLTFSAYRNVYLNEAINATGGGSLHIRADNSGSGVGTVIFGGNGHASVTNGAAVGIYYNPFAYDNAATRSDNTSNPYSGNVTTNGGSSMDAFMLVNNITDLQDMNTSLAGHYALGRDIDASATSGWNSGAGFTPVGSAINPFTGVFDGLFNTITGLYVYRPGTDNVGMFGYNSGQIRRVGLVDVNITGNNGTGVLAALNDTTGTIIDSYTTGNVNGNWSVGGMVAGNIGLISRSYADTDITCLRDSGGLVGVNWKGQILDSYASGSVTGKTGWYTALGALVGVIDGSGLIANNYATGRVSSPGGGLIAYQCSGWDCPAFTGSITGNVWNRETVGQGDYYGLNKGTGLTSTQMKQQANYAGWDFTNTWRINEGSSYPYLAWQGSNASDSVLLTTGSIVPGNNPGATDPGSTTAPGSRLGTSTPGSGSDSIVIPDQIATGKPNNGTDNSGGNNTVNGSIDPCSIPGRCDELRPVTGLESTNNFHVNYSTIIEDGNDGVIESLKILGVEEMNSLKAIGIDEVIAIPIDSALETVNEIIFGLFDQKEFLVKWFPNYSQDTIFTKAGNIRVAFKKSVKDAIIHPDLKNILKNLKESGKDIGVGFLVGTILEFSMNDLKDHVLPENGGVGNAMLREGFDVVSKDIVGSFLTAGLLSKSPAQMVLTFKLSLLTAETVRMTTNLTELGKLVAESGTVIQDANESLINAMMGAENLLNIVNAKRDLIEKSNDLGIAVSDKVIKAEAKGRTAALEMKESCAKTLSERLKIDEDHAYYVANNLIGLKRYLEKGGQIDDYVMFKNADPEARQAFLRVLIN